MSRPPRVACLAKDAFRSACAAGPDAAAAHAPQLCAAICHVCMEQCTVPPMRSMRHRIAGKFRTPQLCAAIRVAYHHPRCRSPGQRAAPRLASHVCVTVQQ